MRRRTSLVVAAVCALLAGAGWGTARLLDRAAADAPAATTSCRSNPLNGVHDPQRLKILSACATFVGKVIRVHEKAPDGDLTFDVAPDSGYASMLNSMNRSNGGIHAEIIPIDQANVREPSVGSHVTLTGAWVLDSWVGWNEIHPVWSVGSGSAPPPATSSRPTTRRTTTTRPVSAPKPVTFRLKAALHGHGRGTASFTLRRGNVCWRFALHAVRHPTRAAIWIKQRGKPAGVVLPLGKRYRAHGCRGSNPPLFEELVGDSHLYHVRIATKAHPHGAVQGRIARAGRGMADAVERG